MSVNAASYDKLLAETGFHFNVGNIDNVKCDDVHQEDDDRTRVVT